MTLANTTRQNNLWSCRSLSAAFCLCTLSTFLFTACGDEGTTENVTNITQTGVEVVASVEDLPKCEKDNQGEQALVKGESSVRICVDGKWFAASNESSKDTVYVNGDFSCTTKELKDKSGLKIVCNGDSIGVVLNGEKGADGKQGIQGEKGADGANGTNGEKGNDGASCAVVEQTDSTVVINCGGQKMTLNLGAATVLDSLGVDSEQIAISLDTLAGVSQKGPFLKGSTVYLYELSDGRTLKQTNGNFVSNITSDDGRFRFTTRDLMSQYALIMVDGKYRNEVTGNPTTTSIRLQAYTDVLSRKNANVNLLTQLEMSRVYYLVTREKKRFKVAKHQAQMDIFDAFHIDTTGFSKSSEDLNVFGNTEADAALLAISVLLQGGDDETALSVLLTEIAGDMESDGEWNDSAARAQIADWAQAIDAMDSLPLIRKNVKSWNLSDTVPDFEKYVKNYWYQEMGFGTCGIDTVPEFTLKGSLVNSDYKNYIRMYLCRSGEWVNLSPWSWDVPNEYRKNPNIAYGELKDSRDNQTYRTAQIGNQTWMAENLNYADTVRTPSLKGHMWCYGDEEENCAAAGRLYTWDAAVDGICPEGWHLPDTTDWKELILTVNGARNDSALKSLSGWGEYLTSRYSYTRNGTDDYGFSALPVGAWYINKTFGNQGKFAYFWSATEHDDTHAYHVYLYVDQTSVSLVYDNKGASVDNTKENGFSVRCIKDK